MTFLLLLLQVPSPSPRRPPPPMQMHPPHPEVNSRNPSLRRNVQLYLSPPMEIGCTRLSRYVLQESCSSPPLPQPRRAISALLQIQFAVLTSSSNRASPCHQLPRPCIAPRVPYVHGVRQAHSRYSFMSRLCRRGAFSSDADSHPLNQLHKACVVAECRRGDTIRPRAPPQVTKVGNRK